MGWGVHDYPGPPDEKPQPVCPVCGQECYTVYLLNGEVVGCDNCILEVNAYEWLADQEEAHKQYGY